MKNLKTNDRINFHKMENYCEAIKEYLEIYDAKYQIYHSSFDAKNELKNLIQNSEINEKKYFLEVVEFTGKLTRAINNGHDTFPFLNWMGKDEEDTFTKKNFDEMMIKVCEI